VCESRLVRARALLLTALLVATTVFATAGCGSDDDDGSEQGEDYATAVEAISDRAYEVGQTSLLALNEVADGSRAPAIAESVLDGNARQLSRQAEELRGLDTPESVASVADDLEFRLDSYSRALQSVATDLRVLGEPRDAARAGARLVLSEQSSSAALARALRTMAVESEN
jgi:hypothetical protein